MNILARRSFDSVRLKGITKFQKNTKLDKQKREREKERDLLNVKYEAFVSEFVAKLVCHVKHCTTMQSKDTHTT